MRVDYYTAKNKIYKTGMGLGKEKLGSKKKRVSDGLR